MPADGEMPRMKSLLLVLGVILGMTGIVWILQGLNLLPGSFMTGDVRWALAGAVALGLGIYLLVRSRRHAGGPE